MRKRIQDLKSDYVGTKFHEENEIFIYFIFLMKQGKLLYHFQKNDIWYLTPKMKVLQRMIPEVSSDAKPFGSVNPITLILSGLALIRRNVKNCTRHKCSFTGE